MDITPELFKVLGKLGRRGINDSVDGFVHLKVTRSRFGYAIARLADQIADKVHFLIIVTGHCTSYHLVHSHVGSG